MVVSKKKKMAEFSSIECIGGRDISKVKPVFSQNSEFLFVANGNIVDVFSVQSGEFIHSLNSDVSISDNIVALFLNPINNNLILGIFESANVVIWMSDNGNIISTYKLAPVYKSDTFKVITAKCHINVIDTNLVDLYVVVQYSKKQQRNLKVFAYETGLEKITRNHVINYMLIDDVGSSNIISFGGPEHIKHCGQNISGRYLCVLTGEKIYVLFLRCIFEPRFEYETAIFNRQEIRLKFCWYQLSGNRVFTSVSCSPHEYDVVVGDDTGRVIVYTGVFLHAEDTRNVFEQTRTRRMSEDMLVDESSSSDENEEKQDKKKNSKTTPKSSSKETPCKKVTVSRNWTWAINSIYHWHSFPVRDVTFSETGNFIFSGGGERTLAEWELPHCKKPRTLPRFPGTIANITISPAGLLVVSTKDNSLHIVDQTSFLLKKVITSIQRLGRDEYQSDASNFLAYDPRTSSLVFNSRKGHVQFYSVKSRSLLFHLDITEENIVSEINHESNLSLKQKTGTTVTHSDVKHISLSHDGLCMASVESLNENYVLKFWNYYTVNKVFRLSNVISKPHKGQSIRHIKFSPSRSELNDPHSYSCVTAGQDDNYILWCCSLQGNKYVWSKEKEDNYHELQIGPVGYSQDGSSLAVGFGPCITLWDRHYELKCSLSHVCDKSEDHYVRFLEWGQEADYSHLIVGACSNWVRVWNTILSYNMWQVPLKASLLISDISTNTMAVFTESDKIYIFNPSSPKPESIISTKGYNSATTACFCSTVLPSDNQNSPVQPWYEKTQLYYLTSQMELMYVKMLDSFDTAIKDVPLVPYKPLDVKTPFSSMIAEKTTSDAISNQKKENETDVLNMGSIDQFLTYTSVSMPPLEFLCSQLIKTTLSKKNKNVISESPSSHQEEFLMEKVSIETQESSPITLNTMDDSCMQWIQQLV